MDILGFLESIYNAIIGLIDLVIRLIQDFPSIISLLTSFALNIPGYFGWLPAGVSGLVISLFSVVVIYMIAGRK